MANWFEAVTKTLADDKLSRRQMVTKMAGVTTATALALLVPADEAFAAISDRGGHYCYPPGTCSSIFLNCQIKKYGNYNCYCLEKIGTITGVCTCNTYCASAPICSSQSDCASGYACTSNNGCGCTTGLCLQKCTKTCVLAPNGAGRTAT